MKYFVFVLLVNFLLVDSRRLSNWANDIKHLSQDPATFGQVCANSLFLFRGGQGRERNYFIFLVKSAFHIIADNCKSAPIFGCSFYLKSASPDFCVIQKEKIGIVMQFV